MFTGPFTPDSLNNHALFQPKTMELTPKPSKIEAKMGIFLQETAIPKQNLMPGPRSEA